MMAKIKKPVYIMDEIEIKELDSQFSDNREKVSKKIYSSMTEERLRTIKIISTAKIKASVELVFKSIATQAAIDMHPNLVYEDLKENTYYKSSNKTNKIPFKITDFKVNEVITIEYYFNDQQFIKTLKFHPNSKDTSTKITYIDVATGMTSILGWYEKHIKNVYIRRQITAFQVQILKAKLMLNLIPKNKINKTESKIFKMLNESQKKF